MSEMSLPGKNTQIYSEIRQCAPLIVAGGLLSIDPSIGSMSSMPGFAYYYAGRLVASGTVDIDPTGTRSARLKHLYEALHKMSSQLVIDVCAYEQVPVSAHGGRSQVSHASLLMASGVVQAAVSAEHFVGIMPVVWKCRARETYKKGDEEDAIEMGYIVVELAKQIAEKDPLRRYGRSK